MRWQRVQRAHRHQPNVNLRAATARRQRVLFGHNATNPARSIGLQRYGGNASIGHNAETPPRSFGSHHGWKTPCPSDPRMSIQRTFTGLLARLGGFGWSPTGVVLGRFAERDGSGSTCPPGNRGTQQRGLRSATLCNLRVRWCNVPALSALRGGGSWRTGTSGHPRPGNVCPSGRNGLRPAYLSGCKGRGLARPSGATGFNLRTLAGAMVGAPSTLRANGPHCRAVLRAPGPTRTSTFVRARRTAVSDNLREVRGHR